MQIKHTLLTSLIAALFLGALSSSSIVLPANASNASTEPGRQAQFFSQALLEDSSAATSYWVVRAYYQDRQMVNELAQRIEPWEVHHDLGYLVVGVDQQQYDWLLSLGFRVEIDQELTDLMNQPHLALPGQTSGIPGYPCYRTVEETLATIDTLVASYPTLATKVDIGDSWDKINPGGSEGYDLMVLKLTNSAVAGPKPKLFLMGSIHAREYTPAELLTRFGEQLVASYSLDADVTWLLDYNEIHLLLQANPDGRKYAEAGYSWRKNTNQNYCTAIPNLRGADLNRNFEFYWGCCSGSSGSPCDLLYRGPTAASEPETQAVQNYVRALYPDLRDPDLNDPAPADASGIFMDIHSYSELVLWSWGFTESTPPNSAALQTLGRKFAFFNLYYPTQAVDLYVTDGSTDDFAYGDLGLAAYTFELGTAFFQDCAIFQDTILPRNLPALLYAAKVARAPYLIPAGPDVTNLPTSLQAEAGAPAPFSAVVNDTRYSNENGAEPSQNIAGAAYTIDTPPWIVTPPPTTYSMAATDGAFNQAFEQVSATIDTSLLSIGRHTVFVRGQDSAGNWGAVSALFLQITQPAYWVTLDPLSSLQGGMAGENITHTLQITNTGSQADSYTISLTSNWPGTMFTPTDVLPSGGSLDLLSGESIEVRVVFTPPAGANPGDVDTAQISVSSQGNPTLTRLVDLFSMVWWSNFFPLVP